LRKVFHALFSLFAPVHVVWLRLAALRLRAFAFINRASIGPEIFPEMRDSDIRLVRLSLGEGGNPQSAIRNPPCSAARPLALPSFTTLTI
jgi:hypothetical protein